MKKVVSVRQSIDNSFGVASVILGILSIIFAGLYGAPLGIVSLIFAIKQKNKSPNKWSKNGKILAIIGIVLSVLATIVTLMAVSNGYIPGTPGI